MFLFLQIFIWEGFSNPQKVNIILLVIYRKYKEARKKGIFVWHFFTGHQVTVMDSQRQPEAQNEPTASAKSRTMPPNYCRCRLFPQKRQNATEFCQNCGFCNRSKPPQRRFSPDAFVRLIVCVWFPLFAVLTEILASQIEQKLKGAKNQTELNRFPPILSNKKSHTTQLSPNWQSFETLESLSRFLVHFKPQSYWRANRANQDFFWFKKFPP